jgi:hypothetical protein
LGGGANSPGATPAPETESHVWRALTVLIPDYCAAGAIPVEGELRVLALTQRTLVEIAPIGSRAGVRAKSRAVDPAAASAELVETAAQTDGPTGGVARIMGQVWTLVVLVLEPGAPPATTWCVGGFSSGRRHTNYSPLGVPCI